MNVAQLLVDRADDESEAVVEGAERLTYAELLRRSETVAAALDIDRGDRVAILLPNGWRYAVAYFGIQLAGGIAVLVNARFAAPEVAYVLENSGAAIVVSDEALAPRLPAGVRWSTLDGLLGPSSQASAGLSGGTNDRAGQSNRTRSGLSRGGDEVANLLYTSGTTGFPKGAMQTHANLLFNAAKVREQIGVTAADRTLVVAPLFHATGINSQLIGFLSAGGCCVLVPAFAPDTCAQTLVEEKITVFAGVAAMLRLILARDASADLSSLRMFAMGGAPVPESFPAEMAERLPALELANVWGLTESTSIVTYTAGADYRAHPATVGRPVPGLEVWVARPGEQPADVRDVVGELCIRGPAVTAGYWGNAAATAEAFVDGWLHTGDVGQVDADGYVTVLDRLKDMIIRGGENVYSLEVENALATHPAVAEVAVVGVPDPIFDERVRAVIVPRGDAPDVDDLRQHAATMLADFKVPAEFRFVTELPRNPAGKILKRRLHDLAG